MTAHSVRPAKIEEVIDTIAQYGDASSCCYIRERVLDITKLHDLMVAFKIINENNSARA